MIDPKERMKARKEAGMSEVPEDGERTEFVQSECTVPGAVVGWEHFESSKKGTPGLLVRFVVLEGPEVGRATERNFWLTDRAMDQLLDFVLAMGWEEPFDPDNDEHLEKIFSLGAVKIVIRGEDYTDSEGEERTTYRPAFFNRLKGKGKKEWNSIVVAGQAGWDRYVKWRESNPRGVASAENTGPDPEVKPRKGKGEGKKKQESSGDDGGYIDEDIPF